MIIVISSTERRGAAYTGALRYFGLIAYQTTPQKALSEITSATSAILIATPDALADAADYVRKVRSYNKSVPVFALTRDEAGIFDLVISPDSSGCEILEIMQDYMSKTGRNQLGVYKLAGLDVSIGQKVQCYCFLDIKFTKTELFILRYLIRSFPIRSTPRDIMKYAYPKRSPSMEAVVRTHVSKINRKFFLLTGRYLINSEPGIGYMIDTPIKPEIYCKK
jgi:DNA-binding response OmpR family regulator